MPCWLSARPATMSGPPCLSCSSELRPGDSHLGQQLAGSREPRSHSDAPRTWVGLHERHRLHAQYQMGSHPFRDPGACTVTKTCRKRGNYCQLKNVIMQHLLRAR